MHLIGISLAIQLLCAVHCVRGYRNRMWLMVIIFLSVPGCLAYAFFEILPGFFQSREVRAVKAAAIRKLDPERGLRRAGRPRPCRYRGKPRGDGRRAGRDGQLRRCHASL
jgi:hypothetical protein